MPRKTDVKADAIRLMKSESNFERSGISAQQCYKEAAPRREEMPAEIHAQLLAEIARDEVSYVIFSYRTPIAWVYQTGAVNLPEVKYSKTTSMHQNWVREAYGDLVNRPGDRPESADTPVVLSENEEIILRRMRDEDGTEYPMIVTGLAEEGQKFCPRDQAEPLVTKGLASYLMNTARGNYGIRLTDKGRAYLDQIQPVTLGQNVTEVTASMYAELGEDDLIDLLSQTREAWTSNRVGAVEAMATMCILAQALKDRRDATAPARRRIGEYLRHLSLNDAEWERTDGRYTHARDPRDILDEIRSDAYTNTARLRQTDLVQVVQPLVRDSKHDFEMRQEALLSALGDVKLPEKQAALLPCIAKGHITSHGSGFSGKDGCTCSRPDGRTMNALMKRDFIGARRELGYRPTSTTLMLMRPKTS